jgi:hypothetical protein
MGEQEKNDAQPVAASPRPGRRQGERKFFLASFPARPIALETDRTYSLGRSEGNNIIVADADVSRHHAVLRWEGDHFKLVDLGSRNGTFVDDERIEEHVLESGDEITCGNRRLTFLYMSEAEAREQYVESRAAQERGKTQALSLEGIGSPDRSFNGFLTGFGLPELIQTLEINRKTGVLCIESGDIEARIMVREGGIVGATCGDMEGPEAVYRSMRITEGAFEFHPGDEDLTEQEIGMSTQALLMEGLRRQDEEGRPEGA